MPISSPIISVYTPSMKAEDKTRTIEAQLNIVQKGGIKEYLFSHETLKALIGPDGPQKDHAIRMAYEM